jgi:nicotinate phosphoribosyltransferase
MAGDTLTIEDDPQPGEPLLQLVMRAGQRLHPSPPLSEVRHYAAAQMAQLPDHLRLLQVEIPYVVSITPALHELTDAVDHRTVGKPVL